MNARVVAILVPLLCLGSVAAADAPVSDAPVVSADPNAPRFGLMFRGAMRAQLGADLTLLGDDATPGLVLSLSPLVELHEPSGSDQVLPSQYWRARVALALGHGWQADAHRYRLSAALEHESDHETAHEYSRAGFLTQNALRVSGDARWVLGALRLWVMPALRVYALSCTRDRERCTDFKGDASFGAQLDVTLDAAAWAFASLVPFVGVSSVGVLGRQRVLGESHAALHLGVWTGTPALLFQAFGLAYLGNDVGITRGLRVAQIGLGLSLSPR